MLNTKTFIIVFSLIFLILGCDNSERTSHNLENFEYHQDKIIKLIPHHSISFDDLEAIEQKEQVEFLKSKFLTSIKSIGEDEVPSLDSLVFYKLFLEYNYMYAQTISFENFEFYNKYEYLISYYENILINNPELISVIYEYFAMSFRAEYSGVKDSLRNTNLKGMYYLEKAVSIWDEIILDEYDSFEDTFKNTSTEDIFNVLGFLTRPNTFLMQNRVYEGDLKGARELENKLHSIINSIPEDLFLKEKMSREVFKYLTIYTEVDPNIILLLRPIDGFKYALNSLNQFNLYCETSYIPRCEAIHLNKAKLYQANNNEYLALDELLKMKDKVSDLPLLDQIGFYNTLNSIDLKVNDLEPDVKRELISIMKESSAEIILLAQLYDSSRRFDLIRLLRIAANSNLLLTANQKNYTTAKLINIAYNMVQQIGIDNLHHEYISTRLNYLRNGHCDKNVFYDDRCEEYKVPTDDEIYNYLLFLEENFNNIRSDLINNWDDTAALLGKLLAVQRTSGDNAYFSNLDRMATIFVATENEIEKKQFQIVMDLANCDKGDIKCSISFYEAMLPFIEDKFTKNDFVLASEYYQAYEVTSALSYYYDRLGNESDHYDALFKSINYFLNFYSLSEYEIRKEFLRKNTVIDDLIKFVRTTAEGAISSSYESEVPFRLEQVKMGSTKPILFLYEDYGSAGTCRSQGDQEFWNIDGVEVANPFFCLRSYITTPSLIIRDLNPNSDLYIKGYRDGDYLIAINEYQLDGFLFGNVYSQRNLDKIAIDLLDNHDETNIVILKDIDYRDYINANENERTSINLYKTEIKIPSDGDGSVTGESFDKLDVAFQAVQILLDNKASDSFDKLKDRVDLKDFDLSKKLKTVQDLELNKYQLQKDIKELDLNSSENFNQILEKRDELLKINKEISTFRIADSRLSKVHQATNKRIYSVLDVMKNLDEDTVLLVYLEGPEEEISLVISGAPDYSIDIDTVYTWPDQFINIDYSNLEFLYGSSNSDLRKSIRKDIISKIRSDMSKKNQIVNNEFLNDYHESKYLLRNLFGSGSLNILQKKNVIYMTNIHKNRISLSILPSFTNMLSDKFREEFNIEKKYFLDDHIVKNLFSMASFELNNQSTIADKNELVYLGVADPVLNKNKSYKNYASLEKLNLPNLFRNSSIANPDELNSLGELPFTAEEVRSVASNFRESKLLLRENANEKTLKSIELSYYDVISFASHIVPANSKNKFDQPGIVLSIPAKSSSIDDGFLTPEEILMLDLDAELVILSGCDSSSGTKSNNEVLSGLAQAFLYAGAKSVIVSNWPAEDRATKILMNNFFTNWLQKDLSIPESLNTAKIFLRDNFPEFSHPSYWGVFSYYGL